VAGDKDKVITIVQRPLRRAVVNPTKSRDTAGQALSLRRLASGVELAVEEGPSTSEHSI